ncbi:PQQ-binding-like beta-propeller repeat protein [Gordonia sp. PKS22-38]|uniref:PQQ-binding-like beta-propeller repeat protein n=1 Tax=Gordonia prachuapensis TaxID=3115651 RepID=A0ABU7MP52_9ACTN|nr:PQQ-binding-like beta-propeller repeat protein [Gordonia sp. PKS22-38]
MGLVIGLVCVSVAAMCWAWFHRTPPVVHDDLDDTMALLRQSFVVVGVAGTLVSIYLAAGVSRSEETSRRHLLALTAPTLAVIGAIGLIAWYRPDTREEFGGAAYEQRLPGSGNAHAAAAIAWWTACFAVIALALVAFRAYRPYYDFTSEPESPRKPAIRAVAAAMAVLLAGGIAVGIATYDSPWYDGQTASDVSVPSIPDRPGQVRYAVDSQQSLVVAGAGYAVVNEASDDVPDGQDTIEGYNGATGERLWWFTARGTTVTSIWSTGVGASSVVVARVFAYGSDGPSGNPYIALDATTGEHLWTKWLDSAGDSDGPFDVISDSVLLQRERLPETDVQADAAPRWQWTALSPRTGDPMWTRTMTEGYCPASPRTADRSIVLTTCSDDSDVIATVLDAATGREERRIRRSDLGVDVGGDTAVSIDGTQGKYAIATISAPTRDTVAETAVLINVVTGREAHRFPTGDRATFIDGDALVVRRPDRPGSDSLSLFDIASRASIPTGLYAEDSLRVPLPWKGLAESWVGAGSLVPFDESTTESESASRDYDLWTISRTGDREQVPDPCTSDRFDLRTMPGALVVDCTTQRIAMN